MASPSGNQFWKLRSTHGRELIFSSPTILWEACCEYFESTDARKWVKKDWVGKDAHAVDRETQTPYTWSGLCLFLDIDVKTWALYENREDFIPICTRVRQIIITQKLEGATVGAFNPMIVSRDIGLVDKTENKNENVNYNIEPTEEEARKIKESLEKGI